MKVYLAISNVMKALAKDGIAKDRKNQQQGYQFRGIDDVYNALAPILSENHLVILPRVISRESVERQTKSGGALFYVTLNVEFDLVCAEDGSKHTISVVGEAMDSADKASNKAMSAAYKYACLQAFCIPTEGDNDADATTHDVLSKQLEYINALLSASSLDELKTVWTSIPKHLQSQCEKAKDSRKLQLDNTKEQ